MRLTLFSLTLAGWLGFNYLSDKTWAVESATNPVTDKGLNCVSWNTEKVTMWTIRKVFSATNCKASTQVIKLPESKFSLVINFNFSGFIAQKAEDGATRKVTGILTQNQESFAVKFSSAPLSKIELANTLSNGGTLQGEILLPTGTQKIQFQVSSVDTEKGSKETELSWNGSFSELGYELKSKFDTFKIQDKFGISASIPAENIAIQ